MCVVSTVGDDWSRRDKWPHWPEEWPFPQQKPIPSIRPAVTQEDLKNLKKEILDEMRKSITQMKEELEAARAQDIAEGNPDCEMEDKVKILKDIAALIGFDLSGVFPNDRTKKSV